MKIDLAPGGHTVLYDWRMKNDHPGVIMLTSLPVPGFCDHWWPQWELIGAHAMS